VLDFGLAKLAHPDAAGGLPDVTASPTITAPAMTGVGVLLGTAGYMSPEQARGLAVDRGADIWAFGCVLFEMLSGARAFPGVDATETIAAIIRAEPEWSLLPGDTPASVVRVLRRCLRKDRARRLADVRDARLDIEDAQNEPAGFVAPPGRPRRRERLAWAAACLLSAAIGATTMLWRGDGSSPAPHPEMRVENHDAADNRSGLAGTVARRAEARLRRVFGWPAKALASFAGNRFRATAGGNRWRLLSVLVAGQPIDRLLCRRRSQSHRHGRRFTPEAGIGSCGGRRHMEPRRRNPVPNSSGLSDFSRARRRGKGGVGARCPTRPAGTPIPAVPA
jgi:hypothetical protein